MTECLQIKLSPSLCRTVNSAHEPVCACLADSAPGCLSEPQKLLTWVEVHSLGTAGPREGRTWGACFQETAKGRPRTLNRSLSGQEGAGGRVGGSYQCPEALVRPAGRGRRVPCPMVLARVQRQHPCEGPSTSLSPVCRDPSQQSLAEWSSGAGHSEKWLCFSACLLDACLPSRMLG